MDIFDPSTFGELNAADYDQTQDPGTADKTVALISELMGGRGQALELAIGSGRVALPLAATGIAVSGIDGSQEMLDLLRAKPGGDAIPCVLGDMADVAIDGTFDHVYLVFNTLFNLLTQEAQIRCFANTAQRLKPGGTFLVEAFVPRFEHYADNQRMTARKLTRDQLWFEAITHDAPTQRLDFQRVRVTESGMKLTPFMMRYAYPPELDLMAKLAGLQLKNRWGGWEKEPFTNASTFHVSVYEKV